MVFLDSRVLAEFTWLNLLFTRVLRMCPTKNTGAESLPCAACTYTDDEIGRSLLTQVTLPWTQSKPEKIDWGPAFGVALPVPKAVTTGTFPEVTQ